MSQLTTNTATIDELITIANNLPDAGSGGGSGGSVETCTVVVNNAAQLDGQIQYLSVVDRTNITSTNVSYDRNNKTLSDVLCNSYLIIDYNNSCILNIVGDYEMVRTMTSDDYLWFISIVMCKSGQITLGIEQI